MNKLRDHLDNIADGWAALIWGTIALAGLAWFTYGVITAPPLTPEQQWQDQLAEERADVHLYSTWQGDQGE
jgi:hypothetical protein